MFMAHKRCTDEGGTTLGIGRHINIKALSSSEVVNMFDSCFTFMLNTRGPMVL